MLNKEVTLKNIFLKNTEKCLFRNILNENNVKNSSLKLWIITALKGCKENAVMLWKKQYLDITGSSYQALWMFRLVIRIR